MIKINLLPYREARKKEAISRQIIAGVVPLLVTCLIIFFFWASITSRNEEAQAEITELQEKIRQSRLKMKDIDNFKTQKETLEKKMNVIKTLDKNKSGPVRMLDEIALSLPGNLWLTRLVQRGSELTLDGQALDNISVSRYMLQLESSAHFNGITLLEVKTETRATVGATPLKSFKMNSQVIYSVDD